MLEITYAPGTEVRLLRTFSDDFYHITDPRFPDKDGRPREGYLYRLTGVLSDVHTGYQLDEWKGQQVATLGIEGARFDMILRQEIGKNVHRLIQNYLRGIPIGQFRDLRGEETSRSQWTDREWRLVAKWVRWFQAEPTEVLRTEMTVWDWETGVAGTLDALLRRQEYDEVQVEIGVLKSGPNKGQPKYEKQLVPVTRTRVWDWKTSKAVMGSHGIQVAAYRKFIGGMFPVLEEELDGAAVLALGNPQPDPQARMFDEDICDALWEQFLRRKAVFDDSHPNLDPDIVELPDEFVPEHEVPEQEAEPLASPKDLQ